MDTMDLEERSLPSQGDSIQIQNVISSLLSLRGKERMEAILSLDNAREVLRSMPEEEVYLTIKEIGEYDSLPLLSLMSSEQCQYLLDLELWKGYEFQPERVEHWLPLLLACEEEALEEWLKQIDLDTLLLLLKKHIRIHLKEREDISSQEEHPPYFTLDGTYYIEVLRPNLQESIERLLRLLAAQDLSFYWRVLEQVQAEIEAELEERALHFREARLEDKGFPRMEDALSLYQYLNPKRLRQMMEQKEVHFPGLPADLPPPTFPMVLQDQKLFFSLCLREVQGGPLMDRLKMELAYMANQVTVADRPERIDLSILQESLRKVGGYLSIGLEWLTGGEIQKAKGFIEEIPLKYIFQVGYGATLELKWRAERIWERGWFSENKVPLAFLGFPLEERMEGLIKKKRPLFYDEEKGVFREFHSYSEIQTLHKDLDRIELLGRILKSLPHFSYYSGVTWKEFLFDTFLRETIPSRIEAPIDYSINEKISFLKNLYSEEELRKTFAGWLLNRGNLSYDRENSLLQEILDLLFKEFTEDRELDQESNRR